MKTIDQNGPVALVIDVSKSPTQTPSIKVNPTVWLFVVSEGAAQPKLAKALKSKTSIILQRPLNDRLRDILREIAIDVERQLISPSLAIPAPATQPARKPLKRLLTPRQIEIVRMISDGLSNKVIAAALGLSVGTVKVHLHRIFQVLGVSNRVQLATHDQTGALLGATARQGRSARGRAKL